MIDWRGLILRKRGRNSARGYPDSFEGQKKTNLKSSKKNMRKVRSVNYDEDRKRSLSEIEERRKKRAERIKKADARREKRQRLTQGKGLIYIVFIFICVYFIGYGLVFMSRENIPFDTIQYGSIDEPKTVKGIIIRDETIYKSTANGAVIFNVSDKEKVKGGVKICSVRDEEAVKSFEDNLNDINKNIFTMQENRSELSLFYDDVKKVNSQIKDIVDTSVYNFSVFNIDTINDFKSAIQKKIETRNQMLLSENRGSLTELVEKKKEQEAAISKSILTLSAKNGGIVSYYTDGLEESINIEKLDNVTKEQTTMESESFDLKTFVSANDRVFKIVNSNEWYIASYIPNNYIEDWKEGDSVVIYTDNSKTDGEISAVVHKLVSNDDESYVVLKITKYLLDYIDTRSINFEISRSEKGLKIPLSSIVTKTILKIPKKYVKDDYVIKVSSEAKENLLIENSGGDKDGVYIYTPENDSILRLGDKIQNPDDANDIYEIKEVINIQGVYIINSGIAEFKTLNTEGFAQNSTHIIINPENNPKIRLYDRILTDTSNVKEDDMIYG